MALGLVSTLSRPGGNMTGLSFAFDEGFGGKLLELLHETVPQASRIAILREARSATRRFDKGMDRAGQVLGLKLQRLEVSGPDQLPAAFDAIAKERAGALLVEAVPFCTRTIARSSILRRATASQRLPRFRLFVEAGGLMSYGVSLPDLWRRSAVYVDRILKGAKPADLPVEQPTKFELVINVKTAKVLGLTIRHRSCCARTT